MRKDTGAKPTYEVGADRHAGQTALTNAIHHTHVGAEESCIADTDGCKDTYSIGINNSAFQKLGHHRQ